CCFLPRTAGRSVARLAGNAHRTHRAARTDGAARASTRAFQRDRNRKVHALARPLRKGGRLLARRIHAVLFLGVDRLCGLATRFAICMGRTLPRLRSAPYGKPLFAGSDLSADAGVYSRALRLAGAHRLACAFAALPAVRAALGFVAYR